MHTLKPLLAEFIGTFALCFVGIGAIAHQSASPDLLMVALAHGLTIAVFVSAFGHVSGGHFNPAVSLGLWVAGKVTAAKMLSYWVAQLAGAIVAGAVCVLIFGAKAVQAGTPPLGVEVTPAIGILIEAILTFFLVTVIFGTAVDARAPKIGGLAIGATVALDILFGGPLTGGAMNPARFTGPALVSGGFAHNPVVYWVGPFLGAAVAGLLYKLVFATPETLPASGRR